jgi:mRNA-degrading endonuclease RelE of RelBE toxin-antitoxin system
VAFALRFSKSAADELDALRTFDARRILDAIRQHLADEPLVPSAARKEIRGADFSFENEPPVWQLRVGDFRVFYDVDTEVLEVRIRAIRRKGRKSTREIV